MRTKNIFQILMMISAITMSSQPGFAQKNKNKPNQQNQTNQTNQTNQSGQTNQTNQKNKTDKKDNTKKDSDYNPKKVKLAFSVSADASRFKDEYAKLGGYTIKSLLALNAKLHAQMGGVIDLLERGSLNNSVEPDTRDIENPQRSLQIRGDLGIQGKGGGTEQGGDTYKVYIYYLTLQPYLLYNHRIKSGGNLFAGLGPYFGYGLFGKLVDKVNGQTTKEKIEFGEDQSGIRRGDFGLGAVAGYTFNNIFVQLSYDFGFSNIGFDKDNKLSNRTLAISVGYMLK